MKTTEDSELMKLMADDPEKGFRLLMAKYREPLYRHIRRMELCHEDAEDAVQETFVRVFRSMAGFKGECSLRSWIYRIATNEALRLLERRNSERTSSIDAAEGMTQIMADAYVDYSDLETAKLQHAISALPEKQQQAFNMRYYDELGYDEIARITGSTAGSAKANYHVAKEKIIKIIGGLVAEKEVKEPDFSLGHITVIENKFGFKQELPLVMGDNMIGRRNKDTDGVDVPIITCDPSVGRKHCIINVKEDKNGRLVYTLRDNDSMTGTFLRSTLIGDKERVRITEGAIITIGATTFVLHTPYGEEEEELF